jgi:hypothetical protein
MDRVALEETFFEFFGSLLSVWFHQCATLLRINSTQSTRHAAEAGQTSNKTMLNFLHVFQRFSRYLSAHTNVTLPYSLQMCHQAYEHNLYVFIRLTFCSHTWRLYGRTKTIMHICIHWRQYYQATEIYTGNIITRIRNTTLRKNFWNQCLLRSETFFR